MNRRDFLLQSLSAAGGLASCATATAQMDSAKPVLVTVHVDQPIAAISPDFLGLGYEISSVSKPYLAKDGLMSRANSVYVQLVRTLGARGVIRIGGNTSDYARYSPADPAVASAFGTVVNDAGLKDLGGFLDATGWNVIWGLDLGKGSEANAVAEAGAVLRSVNAKLLAFEIGNEPDLFGRAKHRNPDYSYDDWLAEYRRYKAALRASLPRIPFAGPDAAGKTDWVTRFAADEGKDIVLLTHHYYREGQNPTSTIEKLLGEDPKLHGKLDILRAASKSCGVPYRICEVNSFSGGGRPGVSDTMAGALWALDYMFTVAQNGCSGVNMESGVNQLDFISSYSPIGDDERGHYSAKPEYYGMLAFSLAGKGTILESELEPASSAVKAYATQPDHGTPGTLTLTLINKGPEISPIVANIGGPVQGVEARVLRLTAPAIDAKTGVTLGGSEVTPEGTWKPSSSEGVRVRHGKLVLQLPAYSAAIVQTA